MATIRQNFDEALAKGTIAEQYIIDLLASHGWQIWTPRHEGSHLCDMIAWRDGNFVAFDVKAKHRRTKYDDTGINENHYEAYKKIKETLGVQFWIIFVDEYSRTVYGNELEELDAPMEQPMCAGSGRLIQYPFIQRTQYGTAIRYWPLSCMVEFGILPEYVSYELRKHNQRNYSKYNTEEERIIK